MSRKTDALRALAAQDVSPREAEIARRKLEAVEAKEREAARAVDQREPCGVCGRLPRAHGPKPTNPVYVLLTGWHEYIPEWEVAWANYQEHDRIADALARQAEESRIADLVRRWERGTYRGMTIGGNGRGVANGDNPKYRIALAGYDGEHVMPESWSVVAWKAHGGYEGQNKGGRTGNSKRERIWFSPSCIRPGLWDAA